MKPSYIDLIKSHEIESRLDKLQSILEACTLCPRECGVNRLDGEEGFCKAGKLPMISSAHPHFGEESPLVGSHGSGTIFFTGCNLGCIYCQNYDISHLGVGETITIKELAHNMLRLQRIGCHNINFVTPTHYTPQMVEGIIAAAEDGLKIPIVYNCGGYEKVSTLKLLEGIVDIYMPDMKYGRVAEAEKYSCAKDYPKMSFSAISEMHRQVGDLKLNKEGIAYRGLLVRHLVLPNDIAGSEEVFRYLSKNVSKNTYINIMDQYHPQFDAWKFDELSRGPTRKEYRIAVSIAKKYGLTRGEAYRHEWLR